MKNYLDSHENSDFACTTQFSCSNFTEKKNEFATFGQNVHTYSISYNKNGEFLYVEYTYLPNTYVSIQMVYHTRICEM